MSVEIPKLSYTGRIKTIQVGDPARNLAVGGDEAYPFYAFEGAFPAPPRIALEVSDVPPEECAEAVARHFRDVWNDPVEWARKCIREYGAEMIDLELVSTDPNGLNRSPEEAVRVVKRVAEAIEVPLIVYGSSNVDKDSEVLRMVCEACEGRHLIVGPVQEKNYKKIGAAAIAFKHTVIANTPIDINLAKQLNILLGNLGVPETQILIDPTTGSLGYGLEYTYSVMERIRMAALVQEDHKLQLPMICNVGKEVWKTKEAKLTAQEAPGLGDPETRGVLLEAITAETLLLAGANIVVLRHPETVKRVHSLIRELAA
jgi:acetyl-CoA decarbonylase/synthase, CODH/ACS complex subunit delta